MLSPIEGIPLRLGKFLFVPTQPFHVVKAVSVPYSKDAAFRLSTKWATVGPLPGDPGPPPYLSMSKSLKEL